MMRTFHRVELPHFVCGFFVNDGVIDECAPVMSWAKGKTLIEFERWALKKGGTVEYVEDDN